MIQSMRYLFVLLFFFSYSVSPAEAHIPVLVEQTSLHDTTRIESPEISQAYYGTLKDFPHTYEIVSREPFTLFAEVLMPDKKESETIVSGIIIREVNGGGRVTEVARMLARDAIWDSFYEPIGGDRYLRGASYEGEQQAGVYRIEVTSPNNDQKYVLVVGKKEDFGSIGYFETIGRIAEVKAFFGKSRIMVIQSPLVYVPILLLVLIGGFIYYRRKQSNKNGDRGKKMIQ
jgi:hypothetical protein